jgi:hypothetical protein
MAALSTLVFGSGCARAYRTPQLDAQVLLRSNEPVRLVEFTPPAGEQVRTCLVNRAHGRIAAQRGDTVVIDSLRVVSQPRDAIRCDLRGPSYVLVADTPHLRYAVNRVSAPRTLGVLLALGVASLLVVGLLASSP